MRDEPRGVRGAVRKPDRSQAGLSHLDIVGESPSFRQAAALIERIARCDATTLIEGETGTGKELAARAIHYLGARRDHPFVPINCGGLPDALLESELFGHERGAFTDARERHAGLLWEARGGTLFLDEVEAMSARAQIVLLRFLQDQRFRPVGATAEITGDVRVVAASNTDLAALVAQNGFRRDLLFRLSVLVVRLPPLRERPGDALLLAETFLARFSRAYAQPPKRLSPASRRWLEGYEWPGNVRELENVILRAFLLGEDGDEVDVRPGAHITGPALPPRSAPRAPGAGQSFRDAKAEAMAEFERRYLEELLREAGGNLSLAARRAGKDRTTLKRLVRRHGLDPHGAVAR